jgi:hypothetical protein
MVGGATGEKPCGCGGDAGLGDRCVGGSSVRFVRWVFIDVVLGGSMGCLLVAVDVGRFSLLSFLLSVTVILFGMEP